MHMMFVDESGDPGFGRVASATKNAAKGGITPAIRKAAAVLVALEVYGLLGTKLK
jgi:hypothetical protein